VVTEFGFGLPELEQMDLNGLDAAFIAPAEKERLKEQFREAFRQAGQ